MVVDVRTHSSARIGNVGDDFPCLFTLTGLSNCNMWNLGIRHCVYLG